MLRAVLVDDEELSVRMLESIIDWNRCGVEIVGTARNGEDTLHLLGELQPDMVLTDIKMPGIDGIELMRRAKSISPQTEFILVSAYADFAYARDALSLGGASYLLKPVDEFELEKSVKQLVGKINAQQVSQRLVENSQRQRDMMTLYAYMRNGTGLGLAQRSAEHLGLSFSSYALMGFVVNESSMNAYIENSVQIDAQLSYLQTRLAQHLSQWGEHLLFDFTDNAWTALLLYPTRGLERCANDMMAFFDTVRMEMHICFTETMHSLTDLPIAFRMLQQLNRYSFFIGEDSILGYGYNCKKSEFDQVALAAARKEFEVHIRQGDCLQAEQVVTSTLKEISHKDPSVLSLVYDFCYSCVETVRRTMTDTQEEETHDWLKGITFQTVATCATLEELHGLMREVISRAGGTVESAPVYSQLVEDGRAYLYENYDRNISLEEICSTLGVSKNYFCYLFKKETGQNLWGVLTDIRIAKAKDLLRTTKDKTYAIAYQIGYDNPSYFSKLFKKHTGVTPNEYRRAPQ